MGVDPAEHFIAQGTAAMGQGDMEGAKQQFSLAAVASPSNPASYCFRGECHAAEGNYIAAAEDFQKAIDIAPALGFAHRFLAECLCAAGDLPGAELAYDHAVEACDKSSPTGRDDEVRNARAEMFWRTGQVAKAMSSYEDIIVLREPAVTPYLMREACLGLGRTCMATGDTARAIEAFKRSIEPVDEDAAVDSDCKLSESEETWRRSGRLEALAALAGLCMRGGEGHEAVLHYTEAIESCRVILSTPTQDMEDDETEQLKYMLRTLHSHRGTALLAASGEYRCLLLVALAVW